MNYDFYFLVTTDKSKIPPSPIVMIDGTVPGWIASPEDLHFDHHRPGGDPIQLTEIPQGIKLPKSFTFVTTQVDADACAAAAYMLLQQIPQEPTEEYEAIANLKAIAYDCDHLGCPPELGKYRANLAKKAVAALKESGNAIAAGFGLPRNRKEWTEDQKIAYASEAFKLGTRWLTNACLGNCPYPGERGEADAYFERMEAMRPQVYANCSIYRGCAIFDQRSFEGYVDPRLLVEWARENSVTHPITLTIRDGSLMPNTKLVEGYEGVLYNYTLGSIPLHPSGSPKFSDKLVWAKLQELEVNLRTQFKLPLPETAWGGRNEVGGSSWRDPMISFFPDIIDVVLACILPEK